MIQMCLLNNPFCPPNKIDYPERISVGKTGKQYLRHTDKTDSSQLPSNHHLSRQLLSVTRQPPRVPPQLPSTTHQRGAVRNPVPKGNKRKKSGSFLTALRSARAHEAIVCPMIKILSSSSSYPANDCLSYVGQIAIEQWIFQHFKRLIRRPMRPVEEGVGGCSPGGTTNEGRGTACEQSGASGACGWENLISLLFGGRAQPNANFEMAP